MKSFFEIIKGLFYFLSVTVGLFFLRGGLVFSDQAYNIIKMILMPGYLIITGLMVGYLISYFLGKKTDGQVKMYSQSFIIGILSGIVLALIYIFI